MISPPKVRRQVLPTPSSVPGPSTSTRPDAIHDGLEPVTDVSAVTAQGAASDADLDGFESQLADRAVSDISSVFTEVFSVQRNQSQEIKRQRQILDVLMAKIKKAEDRNADVETEIVCVKNKIYSKEEWIKDCNKRISALQSGITKLVAKQVDMQAACDRTKHQMDYNDKRFKQYADRMVRYSEDTVKFETSRCPVYQQIQLIRDELDLLQKQKQQFEGRYDGDDVVISDMSSEQVVQQDIDQLKSQLLKTGVELKYNLDKIVEEQKKQKQINQTIKVLEKRNVAQLTRLRRQVKEVQTRNRLKESQLHQLQDAVDTARASVPQ